MTQSWRPTISLTNLQARAGLLAQIRKFFSDRSILEVETPLLSRATVTDPHLHSFSTFYASSQHAEPQAFYLQTSPEFAMKRLLAANSGPIYQITKAFRNRGERGRLHNPEFTLLEWYRPGFDEHDLMNEVSDLLRLILKSNQEKRLTYAEIFQHYIGINPHIASAEDLKEKATALGIHVHCSNNAISKVSSDLHKKQLHSLKNENPIQKDDWLHLLMTHCIEPQLAATQLLFIYDFPASQAALAKISQSQLPVARRFEVYVEGIELANGFYELSDAQEQRKRFEDDLKKRRQSNDLPLPIDENLLAALESGLPDCSGVALGIDRLMMLALREKELDSVISFPLERS